MKVRRLPLHRRLRVRRPQELHLGLRRPEHRHLLEEEPLRQPVWVQVELRLLHRERRLGHPDRLLQHLRPEDYHQRPRRGLLCSRQL